MLSANPLFEKKEPQLWFQRLEAIFNLGGITEETTKYMWLQARLDSSAMAEVREFFTNPPDKEPYTKLKERLITEFTDSKEKNVRKLLQELALGDQRPSQLLREMKKLADGSVKDEFLRVRFLELMPEQIRFVLTACDDTLEKLAPIADRMMESTGVKNSICAITAPPTDLNAQLLQAIVQQLTQLTASVTDCKNRLDQQDEVKRHQSRNRSLSPVDRNTRPRSNSRPRTTVPNGIPYCFYHYRFGKNAQKCKTLDNGAPCTFSSSTGN